MRISADKFAKAITDQMGLLVDDVREIADRESERMAKDTVKRLKEVSPKKTGKYAKSWRSKYDPERSQKLLSKVFVVYNFKYGQITKWLEHGHAIPSTGGRTRSFPHIGPTEKWLSEEFPKRVEEAISNEIG